jgi:hypothetical protein
LDSLWDSTFEARAARASITWPLPAELDETGLEALLFAASPAPTRERIAPDCIWIHQEQEKVGVTLHLLWEEYRVVHQDGYGYSQFCEIYRRFAGKLKLSMRQQHRVGEKTFIDYSGKKPHIVDPKTGEEIQVELFVAVLGASSFTYAEATRTQQLDEWVSAHTRMLEYLGGSTAIWVPDQLFPRLGLSALSAHAVAAKMETTRDSRGRPRPLSNMLTGYVEAGLYRGRRGSARQDRLRGSADSLPPAVVFRLRRGLRYSCAENSRILIFPLQARRSRIRLFAVMTRPSRAWNSAVSPSILYDVMQRQSQFTTRYAYPSYALILPVSH